VRRCLRHRVIERAGSRRHQPPDDDVRRQGLSAQAMDGDRPAGPTPRSRSPISTGASGPTPACSRSTIPAITSVTFRIQSGALTLRDSDY
jgi:hypothetical protein